MVLAEALGKNATIRYWHRGAIGEMNVYVTGVSGTKVDIIEDGCKSSFPLNGNDFHVEKVYVSGKSVYDYDPNNLWFKK